MLLSSPTVNMHVMELLIAILLLAIIGVLAQAAGTDSRDANPRYNQPAW